jgi:hypothetical protein
MRLAGIFQVIETTFAAIIDIEDLDTINRSDFFNHLKNIKIPDQISIDIQNLNRAHHAVDFYIQQNLILAGYVKDESITEDFKYRYHSKNSSPITLGTKSKNSTINSNQIPLLIEPSIDPIELLCKRIILQPGNKIKLTELSAKHWCKRDTFLLACKVLEDKKIGKLQHDKYEPRSTAKSTFFEKYDHSKLDSNQQIEFANELLNFDVALSQYETTIKPDQAKRLASSTSFQNNDELQKKQRQGSSTQCLVSEPHNTKAKSVPTTPEIEQSQKSQNLKTPKKNFLILPKNKTKEKNLTQSTTNHTLTSGPQSSTQLLTPNSPGKTNSIAKSFASIRPNDLEETDDDEERQD